MTSSMSITVGMAKVILAVIGRTHEQILSLGWPNSYEFYCPDMFDVKLSYDSYDEGYYIKSYPSEAYLNMCHFLRFFVLYSKGLRSETPPDWMVFGKEGRFIDYNLKESMYNYRNVHRTHTFFGTWIKDDFMVNAHINDLLSAVRTDK